MNCIFCLFDIDVIENFYIIIFIMKSGIENVFNYFVFRDSDIYVIIYLKFGIIWIILIFEYLVKKVSEKGILLGFSIEYFCFWLDMVVSIENWCLIFLKFEKVIFL